MTDYDIDIEQYGVSDGESWQECAERIRGGRRRLHPLVHEVYDDD
jgi:hypothetical protein